MLALLALGSPALAQLVGPNIPVNAGPGFQHEPQVAAFGNTLVAVWHRYVLNRHSGWGLSLDGGMTWSDGGGFPLGPDQGTFGQATVCVDNAGRFYVATLHTTSVMGVAIYRGMVQAGSLAWEGPTTAVLTGPSGGFNLPCPLDAPRLTCDPERGYLYLSYTRTRAVAQNQFEYTIEFVRSLDGGSTWSAPQVLSSGTACNGSRPAVGPDGEVYVVWEDFAARQVVGRRSIAFGTSFGPPFVVGEHRSNLGTAPSGWWQPWWRRHPLQPHDRNLAYDFPSLAVDRSQGPNRGRLFVGWTDHVEAPLGPASGFQGVVEPNGQYGRATPVDIGEDFGGFVWHSEDGGDGDVFTFIGTAGTTIHLSGQVTGISPSPTGPQRLGYRLRCEGDTAYFSYLGAINQITPLWLPPSTPVIYTLPVDGRYYIELGAGYFYSFGYRFSLRAMSPPQGQAAQDHRDVVLTWSDDGGMTWTARRRVSDAPPRYDESFPAVAVDDLGRVHLAWYDRRDDPTCGERVHAYWTFSTDGGVSFVPSRLLSTQTSSWNFLDPNNDSNIGDHLGLTTASGRVHVLWTDTRGTDTDIYGVRIDDVPTGIAVPRFAAEVSGGHVRLQWTVADASGIVGFRLHRAEGGSGPFELLEMDRRPSTGPGEYQAEDRMVAPGSTYRYRLEVVREGANTWEGPVAVSIPHPIARLAWRSASPNPSERTVCLELAPPRVGETWVRIYDLVGQEVVTLHRGALSSGLNAFTWEGLDRAGRPVAAGVYLLRADLDGERAIRRLVRVR